MGSLWNRSGTVERYADDIRAAGAQAFFFAGGTTTPMTVYRDAGESSAHPFPLVADANGRWPDVFVPYTISYDVQVKTADGVQLTYSLQIPNPNPVTQTVTIPPANQVQTGMIHAELVNATKAGFVRLNGRTLGNGSSGATEYANGTSSTNAPIEPNSAYNLFAYLWNIHGAGNNTIFPVSGGRGASAAADFNAPKTITLADMRGATFVGLDDMGNSAAGAFSSFTFAVGSAIIGGSLTGANGVTLSLPQMPAHSHGGSTGSNGGHTHAVTGTGTGTAAAETTVHVHAVTGNPFGNTAATAATGNESAHTHPIGTGAGTGGAAQLVGTSAVGVGGPTLNTVNNTTINNTGAGTAHNHTLSGNTSGQDTTHTHTVSVTSLTATAGIATATAGQTLDASSGAHSHSVSTDVKGGTGGVTQPFNNLGLSRLVTWFIKL